MKRLIAALTVPVLAGTALTGCSGEDEKTNADATTSTSPSPSTASEQPSEGKPSVDPDAPGAGSAYCDLLSTDFASLFSNIQGPEDVEKAVGVVEKIADEAPAEVKQEWGVMEGALGQMKGALTQAAALQKKASEGKVSKQQLQKESARLMKDMQALDTPENNKAGDAVSKHAGEYCGVKLG